MTRADVVPDDLVVSHELLDMDLDRMRADAHALLRAAREICPTVCMRAEEHRWRNGTRIVENPAVSDLRIEVSTSTTTATGGCAFIALRMRDRTASFRMPATPESIAAAGLDLPGFVLARAEEFSAVAETVSYEDPGHEHLEDVASLSWIMAGEGSSIILPTPWSGAIQAPWTTFPGMDTRMRDAIRARTGARVELHVTPEDAVSHRHEIAYERIEAFDPGAVEAMRVAARWRDAVG